MKPLGTAASSVIEGLRDLLIRQREQNIMALNTTLTELAERIAFLEQHKPGHPMIDETRRRLADVRDEIERAKQFLENLKAGAQ